MTVQSEATKARIKRIHEAFIALMLISRRRFVEKLQSFGLTHPQFVTLAALAAHKKPCSMSDLTNVTFQDAPTMTGIINRLIKMNLVQRTRSQVDRRVVLVEVTEDGIALAKQIEDKTFNDDFPGYASLNEDELSGLEQLLYYILRMHLAKDKKMSDSADLDAEIEKLQHFMSDPIYYMQLTD